MEDQKNNQPDLTQSGWELKWQSIMAKGQQMAQHQQWESAAIFYKEAFILAENSLCSHCSIDDCDKTSLSSYLTSALELGKTIKKNEYQCALIALIENLEIQRTQVNCAIEFDMYSSTINKLVGHPTQSLRQLVKANIK